MKINNFVWLLSQANSHVHKVLFIASHRPDRSPNQRFRYEQYIPFLEANGIQCDRAWIVSETDDQILYSRGNYLKKVRFLRRCQLKRREDLKAVPKYDAVFICREALLTGETWFEEGVKKAGKKIIYDFDDAIWLPNVSRANRWFSFLKKPSKTSKLIGLADLVLAGNDYLADYAGQFNSNVRVMPTTVDTSRFTPGIKDDGGEKVIIGWSGSSTTISHFELALPALREVKKRFGDKVEFRVTGDPSFCDPSLGITGKSWQSETEVENIRAFDIGIMPLPEDNWSEGKCGLKGLLYMAAGVPAVMSPVGVNKQIISHGNNGFLASTTGEWVEQLSALILDAGLRQRAGMAGRETVEQRYSVESQKNHYLNFFKSILTGSATGIREKVSSQPV